MQRELPRACNRPLPANLSPPCTAPPRTRAAFLANLILINLIITLMGDLYTRIKEEQDLVFLRNRAGERVEG